MESVKDANKRIARNTILLYIRTFLILIISLYTSRVVINTLGIEDYGIYNVVGGFVAMFSIISATLTGTTQRYLTFELGKVDNEKSKEVFGAALNIHIGLSLILLLLLETIGLWFINVHLNIPSERLYATNWVYQCSLLTFLLNILSAPYNAAIIAHEKMGAFAYISLLEVVLKLIAVLLLAFSPFDQLIYYSILLLLVAIVIRMIYTIYCKIHFDETKYVFCRNKSLYRDMAGFAGMTFLGGLSNILSNQGVNILLNLFFGVTVNAARGISVQVQGAVTKFVMDFTTAINPQITKSYAANDIERSLDLVYKGSRFSFYLLLMLALPIMFKTPYILQLWLKQYPEFTVAFVVLTLILAMTEVLSTTLTTAIFATGTIKNFCLWIGGLRLLNLPICYVLLKMGGAPTDVFYVLITMNIVLLFVRIIVISKLTNTNGYLFVKNVVYRVILVAIAATGVTFLINKICPDTILGLLFLAILSCSMSSLIIYSLGLKKTERQAINHVVNSKISNFINR